MTKFRTHLILNLRNSRIVNNLDFSSADFNLELLPEPTKCFWESKDGKAEIHYEGGRNISDFNNRLEIQQKELIINCSDESIAENALSLIKGGILLAYPDPYTTSLDLSVSNSKERSSEFYKNYPNNFQKLESAAFGCQVLEKIFNKKDEAYALEKYKVSLELLSFTPRSADPRYGQVFDHYSNQKRNHTRAAFAIITAFSAIEELGLEIRSSAKNPRFLNNNTGEWNPKVLKNLNKRLKEKGISNTQTFDWIFRGEQTEIEKNIKPYFGIDSEWIRYGENVRDKTLTFPEALHNASYLRNYIAAHKFKELTQFISPYDVFNVQMLARKLILESLGMWNILLERNKTVANNGYR
jgi:hypothetical protein